MDVYVILRYGLEYMPVFNDMIQLKILSKGFNGTGREERWELCKGHASGISRRRGKKRRDRWIKEEKEGEKAVRAVGLRTP